jgi:hypothetical protein
VQVKVEEGVLRYLAGCVCTVSQGAQLTQHGGHWWLCALRCCSLSGAPRAPMEREPSPLHVGVVSQCVHR